jgi:hypothetical protein
MGVVSRRHMQELLSAYVGEPEGLPPVDLEGQTAFIEEYFAAGAPELKALFALCNLSLRLFSFLFKGRSFSRLGLEQRQDLLNRLLSSRNPLLRGVGMLPGLPLLMSYYRRPEVAIPLGFDSKALKEESNLRVVTRDSELPPKQEGQP